MLDENGMWIFFAVLVAVLFFFDFFVFNHRPEKICMKKAIGLSVFWIAVGLLFGVAVYLVYDPHMATTYYTAYVIEKMMSVDNLFVFIVIFSYFCVPEEYQHKALFMGVLGAVFFRLLFIFAGVQLIERFGFMMYVFAIILILTAIRTVTKDESEEACHMDRNLFVRFCRRFMKVSDTYDGGRFFTRKNGIRMATPLLMAVIVLEMTDILFAMDSIPAVLAITTNTFIIYSSNVFAILGLRSLYFALRGALSSLAYLKYGLGAILVFVGVKMILSASGTYHFVPLHSLVIIMSVITFTVLISVMLTRKERQSGNQEGAV
jgi:tellurite resistance protein TerC